MTKNCISICEGCTGDCISLATESKDMMSELVQFHNAKMEKLSLTKVKKAAFHQAALDLLMPAEGFIPILSMKALKDYHWKKVEKFKEKQGSKFDFHYRAHAYVSSLVTEENS